MRRGEGEQTEQSRDAFGGRQRQLSEQHFCQTDQSPPAERDAALEEVDVCAAQRKVARAQHRGTTYEEENEEEWELEACRCPKTTDGLNVLAVRSVLLPNAKYLFRAPDETDTSMYERAGEVLASLPERIAEEVFEIAILSLPC
ncbi:hypothetical protein PPROV_000957800 [Pycnococcus provasolii]|uniref:Uncharacterized protein n=1 Tax=Pycnococcus provasolii TaxID=41880 RepID=A0A830I126_9CHLO|nr:hypothetical protein PPROV_000957800 [Pycnococcus provasolii]